MLVQHVHNRQASMWAHIKRSVYSTVKKKRVVSRRSVVVTAHRLQRFRHSQALYRLQRDRRPHQSH